MGSRGLPLAQDTKVSSPPDEVLLDRVRKGEKDAFDLLFQRYQASIYRLCYGLVGDVEEACDQTQETFLRAYQNLASFRGEAAFTTWLYRIAVNECRQWLRRRRPWEPWPVAPEMEMEESPEEAMLRVDLQTRVQRALQRLRSPYRTVLVLRYFQDLSYPEMAEVLDCSVGRVKVTLHRARGAFQREYAAEEGEEV